MASMIEAASVVKRFGRSVALDGLELVAERGVILAVLGPNGAGKTTFVRCIATLIKPDGGTLRVFGRDVVREPQAVRSSIGLAGQVRRGRTDDDRTREPRHGRAAFRAGSHLSPSQHHAGPRADGPDRGRGPSRADVFGRHAPQARSRRKPGRRPRLVLLDEPTTGLDPRSRIELWEAIRNLVDRGTNVLLTTQYLDEADHLADEIVIINHGKAIAHGTPAELKRRTGRNVIEVHVRDREDVTEVAKALNAVGAGEAQIDESTRQVTVLVDGGTEQLNRALMPLEQRAITLEDVALRPPKLDEVFLALTGQGLAEEHFDDAVDPATSTGSRNGATHQREEARHVYDCYRRTRPVPCHKYRGHRQAELAQVPPDTPAPVDGHRAGGDVSRHLPVHLWRRYRCRRPRVRGFRRPGILTTMLLWQGMGPRSASRRIAPRGSSIAFAPCRSRAAPCSPRGPWPTRPRSCGGFSS
jgi:ABC-2 type transport system ATP-binding protein